MFPSFICSLQNMLNYSGISPLRLERKIMNHLQKYELSKQAFEWSNPYARVNLSQAQNAPHRRTGQGRFIQTQQKQRRAQPPGGRNTHWAAGPYQDQGPQSEGNATAQPQTSNYRQAPAQLKNQQQQPTNTWTPQPLPTSRVASPSTP